MSDTAVNIALPSLSRIQLETILDDSPVGIGITRYSDGIIDYVNAALADSAGLSFNDMIGTPAIDYFHDMDAFDLTVGKLKNKCPIKNYRIQVNRSDGMVVWHKVSLIAILVGDQRMILSWHSDTKGLQEVSGNVTALDNDDSLTDVDNDDPLAEVDNDNPLTDVDNDDPLTGLDSDDPLIDLDNYDPLTGLANIAHFHDYLNQAAYRSSSNIARSTLLYLGVDGFQRADDNYGHQFAKQILVAAVSRIQSCTDGDFAARISDDEFALIIESTSSNLQDSIKKAEAILAAVSEPYLIDGRKALLSVNIGVTHFVDASHCADNIVTQASKAMYRAKYSGKNRIWLSDSTNNV
jgi:diguanylate cyclase (GGDEF)-like protein/PAS domain S-box-containing protein